MCITHVFCTIITCANEIEITVELRDKTENIKPTIATKHRLMVMLLIHKIIEMLYWTRGRLNIRK